MDEIVTVEPAVAGNTTPAVVPVSGAAGVAGAPAVPPVTVDIQAEIKKAQEDADKKWQAKFDKVLAEKKTVETGKLTTEERLAKMEQERIQERVSWARKEARARATISEEMEAAIQLYYAEDPEDIGRGATEIRKLIDAETGVLKAKIEELEKKIKYGTNPPAGGASATAETTFSRSAMRNDPVLRKKYSDAILADKGVSLTD